MYHFLAECALTPNMQQLSGNRFFAKCGLTQTKKHHFLGTVLRQSARWRQNATHFIFWEPFSGGVRADTKPPPFPGNHFVAECALTLKIEQNSGNCFLAECRLTHKKHRFLGTIFWQPFHGRARADTEIPPFPGNHFLTRSAR